MGWGWGASPAVIRSGASESSDRYVLKEIEKEFVAGGTYLQR